jgi:class 3 adenylate cyclase
VLVTLLFTDIVGSTEIAGELGDRRWRDLIRRHHAIVRRQLKRHRGRELDTAGDGFFARFDRPADAIRCACAISDEVRELGIEIRAGLHVGEAEVVENKVGGIVVNVAARVMGVGKAGEVLVSSTVRDAVAGSGFGFTDHGVHQLKGIEGEWHLFEVMSLDGVRRSLPLGDEEARTRRSFVEGSPAGMRRDRIAAAAVGAALLGAMGVGMLAGAFDGERAREGGPMALSPAERAVLELVPSDLRDACRRGEVVPPDASAAVDCVVSEDVTATYASFTSADDLADRFEAFAAGADGGGTDCARNPQARQPYSVNSQPRGDVVCFLEDADAGPATTRSVIVWTDDELLVLGRAVRSDAADLTLYEWWRTEAGPVLGSALPPKDGEPEVLEGVFHTPDGESLSVSSGEFVPSGFSHGEPALALLGKPNLLFAYHRVSTPTFGGVVCPTYEVYRWRKRGRDLALRLVGGGCREYNSEDIAQATWIEGG